MKQADLPSNHKFYMLVLERIRHLWSGISPGPGAWRGAAWGMLSSVIIVLLVISYFIFAPAGLVRFAAGTLLLMLAIGLIGGIFTLLWRMLNSLPVLFIWVCFCMVVSIFLLVIFSLPVLFGLLVTGIGIMVFSSLSGAGISVFLRHGWSACSGKARFIASLGLILGITGLVFGTFWLLDDGAPLVDLPRQDNQTEQLDMSDPSLPGDYAVNSLFYGTGSDLHRPEYGAAVDLITAPVDGSGLIDTWNGLRTSYWGFEPDDLPLNGRVWYPEGAGPFPLVLIVHGNHPMEDYSDGGYAYLADLLASRGFIVVSIDENFLNLSLFADVLFLDRIEDENDLRGWLLLEHLRTWEEWSETPGNPFYGLVNLDQIALIGHSRGGEAVAIAAAFNNLDHYPDDGRIQFDYHFNIRSLAAISPSVDQYNPAGKSIKLENVNYLVLHGAHDMDVVTFEGSKQYQRIQFSEDGDWFKTSLYIYGANHGQFNTTWGRTDMFEPIMRVFNTEQLLPSEQQEKIAEVYISAFLETTLKDEPGYRPLFRDYRAGAKWLPATAYINQYEDSSTRIISNFQEDLDITTTTISGGILRGENLSIWREGIVEAKWEDMDNSAVFLGWETGSYTGPASYSIQLPETGQPWAPKSVLVFSLAEIDESPFPDRGGIGGDDLSGPIDLTVEVEDRSGEIARLPLSHFSALQPQLRAQLGKAAFMSTLPFSEAVFQHFEFPLEDFKSINPAIDLSDLINVCLIFDRTRSGVIVLDDIGFRE